MSDSVGTIKLDLVLQSKLQEQIEKLTSNIATVVEKPLNDIKNKINNAISAPTSTADSAAKKVEKSFSKMSDNISDEFMQTKDDINKIVDDCVSDIEKANNAFKSIPAEAKPVKIKKSVLASDLVKDKDSDNADKMAKEAEKLEESFRAAETPLDRLNQSLDFATAELGKQKQKCDELFNSYKKLASVQGASSPAALKAEAAFDEAAKKQIALKNNVDKISSQILKQSTQEVATISKSAQTQSSIATSSLSKLGNGFTVLKNKAGKATQSIRDKLKGVNGNVNKTNSLVNKLGKTFKSVFKAVFITAAFYAAFRGLKSAITEAMSDNEEFKNSLNSIKGNLKVAFAPIINNVIPLINQLLSYVNKASAAIAGFVSGLFGKTYDQSKNAVKQAAAVKKEAEKTAKYLNSYDVINKAPDETKSEDKDENAIDYNKVNANGSKAGEEFAKKFKSQIKDLFEPVKKAWEKVSPELIAKGKKTIGTLKGLIGDIGKDVKKVWTGGAGQRYVESLLKKWAALTGLIDSIGESLKKAWNTNNLGEKILTRILSIFTNINNFVTNLATNFQKAWEKAGVGDKIMTNILELVEKLFGFVDRITGDLAKWAGELDFSPLLESINEILEALNPLVEVITDSLGDAFENILLPLGKWTIEKALPEAISTLASVFNLLSEAVKAVKPGLQYLFDKVLKPIGKWLGDTFLAVMGKVKKIINAVTDVIKDKKEEIDNVIHGIADVLSWIWQKVIKPVFDLVKKFVLDKLDTIFGSIKTTMGGIIDTLSGIVDFIKSVFAGDWKKAWESIKKIFKGVWDTFTGIIEGVINGIVDGLNFLWSAIYRAVRGVVNCVSGVVEALGDLFGQEWGFEMPEDPPLIPHVALANGGLVNGPTLSLVGDNKNARFDPEVVSPLSKLKTMMGDGEYSAEMLETLKAILTLLENLNPVFYGMIDKEVLYKAIVQKNTQNTQRTGVNALAL